MMGSAYAQSKLPACEGYDINMWNNCIGQRDAIPAGKIIGEFKDGKLNGQGTATYVDGSKFVGEYKDDKRNGQGTFTLPDGGKYVGEHKDGNANGQGTFTFANGEKYVGEFKDGRTNGQGVYLASNGDVIKRGTWSNGEFAFGQNPQSCNEYLNSLNLQVTNRTNVMLGELGLLAKVVPSGNIQAFIGLITEFNDKLGSIQGFSTQGVHWIITPISQGAFFNISRNTKFYINPKDMAFNSTIVKVYGKYVNNRRQNYTNSFGRVETVVNPVVDAICIEKGN